MIDWFYYLSENIYKIVQSITKFRMPWAQDQLLVYSLSPCFPFKIKSTPVKTVLK